MNAVVLAWWAGTCAVFGAALGSYLGVVIDRLPVGRSLRGRSTCGSCGRAVLRGDNAPALSYVLLHGQCRSCGGTISPVWCLLEVGLAALWAMCAVVFEPGWVLAPILVLVGLVVAVLGLFVAVRRCRAAGRAVTWRWRWLGAAVPVVASALLAVLAGSVLQGSGCGALGYLLESARYLIDMTHVKGRSEHE